MATYGEETSGKHGGALPMLSSKHLGIKISQLPSSGWDKRNQIQLCVQQRKPRKDQRNVNLQPKIQVYLIKPCSEVSIHDECEKVDSNDAVDQSSTIRGR